MTDWSLTEIFIKEVMGMDERQIKAIRQFADRLADHISQTNDRGLFRDLVYSQRPWEVRNALTKAQRNQAKEKGRLLFGLEEYLNVFEAESAVGRGDWSLSRDLISIRLVEQLYNKGFFSREDNRELLAEPETRADEKTN
jgi:CRISPR-associated protein Cst1